MKIKFAKFKFLVGKTFVTWRYLLFCMGNFKIIINSICIENYFKNEKHIVLIQLGLTINNGSGWLIS